MARVIRKSFSTERHYCSLDRDALNPDSCEQRDVTQLDFSVSDSGSVALVARDAEGEAISISLPGAILRDVICAWIAQVNFPSK